MTIKDYMCAERYVGVQEEIDGLDLQCNSMTLCSFGISFGSDSPVAFCIFPMGAPAWQVPSFVRCTENRDTDELSSNVASTPFGLRYEAF